MISEAFLLIGGNVGCTTLFLSHAMYLLEERAGAIIATSNIYQTGAWGNTQQQDFLNQAIHIATALDPLQLLKTALKIEQELGRQRKALWAPRTIDIDIILFGQHISTKKLLTLPHPRMAQRRFVLAPLAEIAGHSLHPTLHKTINELFQMCDDNTHVEIYSAPS
jgi:2-amino-4-hydroxy-6-hydroxymethyldihydropteridine diphosphokinase